MDRLGFARTQTLRLARVGGRAEDTRADTKGELDLKRETKDLRSAFVVWVVCYERYIKK